MNKKLVVGILVLIGIIATGVMVVNSTNNAQLNSGENVSISPADSSFAVNNSESNISEMDKKDNSLRNEALYLIENDGYPELEGVNSLNNESYFDSDSDRCNNPNNPYCEDYSLRDNVSMDGYKVFVGV